MRHNRARSRIEPGISRLRPRVDVGQVGVHAVGGNEQRGDLGNFTRRDFHRAPSTSATPRAFKSSSL